MLNLESKKDLFEQLYDVQQKIKTMEAFHLKCQRKPQDENIKLAYGTIDLILKSLTYVANEFQPPIAMKPVNESCTRQRRAQSVFSPRTQKLPEFRLPEYKLPDYNPRNNLFYQSRSQYSTTSYPGPSSNSSYNDTNSSPRSRRSMSRTKSRYSDYGNNSRRHSRSRERSTSRKSPIISEARSKRSKSRVTRSKSKERQTNREYRRNYRSQNRFTRSPSTDSSMHLRLSESDNEDGKWERKVSEFVTKTRHFSPRTRHEQTPASEFSKSPSLPRSSQKSKTLKKQPQMSDYFETSPVKKPSRDPRIRSPKKIKILLDKLKNIRQ